MLWAPRPSDSESPRKTMPIDGIKSQTRASTPLHTPPDSPQPPPGHRWEPMRKKSGGVFFRTPPVRRRQPMGKKIMGCAFSSSSHASLGAHEERLKGFALFGLLPCVVRSQRKKSRASPFSGCSHVALGPREKKRAFASSSSSPASSGTHEGPK